MLRLAKKATSPIFVERKSSWYAVAKVGEVAFTAMGPCLPDRSPS